MVSLHSISSTAACPQCGTAGSRVHSRYERTIADVAFGRRCLVLKLLVRKWLCPLASCSQCIFAERFPELVQRYARMTDRLIEALQVVGVTTNGADAAQIVSSLGMPTTAKTIIRRVLQLALPTEGTVHVAGIDEWAWKKGSHYGTILVDLEQRRMATRGAPHAQQVADRFHLQQNLVEALKRFFQRNAHVLKTTTRTLSGQMLPLPTSKVARHIDQASQRYHATRIMLHQLVWELFHAGHPEEEIARLDRSAPCNECFSSLARRRENPSPDKGPEGFY